MLLNGDYIIPRILTGYVRTALADREQNKFTLSRWLPSKVVDDIDYRVLTGGTGLSDTATFRTFDAESPIGRRQGLSRLTGELPPISVKLRLGEYDRLRQRQVAEQAISDALFNDADVVTDMIAARIEVARGQVLSTGTLTISENGLVGISIDWGRNPAHSVTAATLWSNGASDPLADALSWRDTYIASNGEDPGAIVVSRRGFNTLMRNQAVRNAIFPGANQPSIVSEQQVSAALASFGLPPIYIYQAQVKVNGVATKILPDNLFLYLPAPGTDNQLGATLWGTTAESLEPEYGLGGDGDEGDAPGLVAGVYKDQDPVALWTKAAAIALPTLPNPDLSFAATIL